jgi:hypothetical protein
MAAPGHYGALQVVFGGLPSVLGGIDVECPICGKVSRPEWSPFYADVHKSDSDVLLARQQKHRYHYVGLDWMRCAHEDCEELIVRVHEQRPKGWIDGTGAPLMGTDTWFARPRFGESKRPIHSLVKDPYRTDYLEATALLDISPRMSAVLARRILGDLLKDFAGKKHWSLTARIRAFIKDGTHPSSLTTNLDHLREIADFGSHTQEAEAESETGEMETVIIDADRDDAEWTLDLVDRLFDYLIVTPSRDEEMKQKWDDNIRRTKRKELRPTSYDEDDES